MGEGGCEGLKMREPETISADSASISQSGAKGGKVLNWMKRLRCFYLCLFDFTNALCYLLLL